MGSPLVERRRPLPWHGNAAGLEVLPRDVAVAFLVEWLNEALAQYSDGVSEDAREPYGGLVTIDGAVLRLRPSWSPSRSMQWSSPVRRASRGSPRQARQTAAG